MNLIKYFNNIINYFCNFFLTFSGFLMELFYNIAYNNNKFILFNTFIYYKFFQISKFCNTFFNSVVNNYYISDSYTKNSKVMSFSSLKKYKIFKLI